MGTIRVRFIIVALVVSFFAVGMAAFLNYFKYKSTISSIVRSRVLVIGRNIENSVQASLSVGMQFMELGTMNQLLAREKASDRLIRNIEVFDHTGQVIYSTDRQRVGEKVPPAWTEAAARSKTTEWGTEGPDEYVAGISLKNNFDLTVGYLALRYSAEEVERAAKVAGREILLASIFSFLGIALIAPLALIVVIRRFERDLRALEAAASHLEDKTDPPMPTGSAFDAAIGNLRTSLKDANVALDDLRAKLDTAA
ncbi:MAG TPA: hypothetical protein VKR38_10775 [Usitatibacter sp.]|nr:hypothetical protein [Usitatibacter sp.]